MAARRYRRTAATILAVLGSATMTVLGPGGVATSGADPTPQADPNPSVNPAVVRSDTWYERASLTTGTAESVFVFGNPGDKHLYGDWDNIGAESPGVVRSAVWYLQHIDSVESFAFGDPSDTPIKGRWSTSTAVDN